MPTRDSTPTPASERVGVFAGRFVPAHQQSMRFLLAEQRARVVRLVQSFDHLLVGPHVITVQPCDHLVAEHPPVIDQRHVQHVVVGTPAHVGHQVEVRLLEAG